jgi:trans-2,3-dihydro-3-hydroxyanthranilate isomerase
MQRAARELNLSETVFLLPADADLVDDEPDPDPGPGPDRDPDPGPGADAHARARIFTPTAELPFAGHPVLGTAFILGQRLGVDTVRLLTGAGPITIALQREDDTIVFGEMEQPIPSWEPLESVQELLAALGVERSGLPVEVYDNGPRHVFVELPSGDAVAMLSPDMQALMGLGNLGVSCFSVSGAHVKTRMFAPGMGVPEDPATGSAAGPLAVHLARHGRIGFGQRIDIRQGAEIGRPSRLEAVADGSSERLERVAVGGSAVVVARGEYRLEPAG